jgi:thiosulfate dehydrogenase [quinone] large subunit
MRIAAVSGASLLMLMWSAVLPPAANPFIDDHVVYAVTLLALVLARAGHTLGLGHAWERLDLVRRYPILR